jgi:hypothetical protein
MRYFLWIKEKQSGPFDLDQIVALFEIGTITSATLGFAEDGAGDWTPINQFPEIMIAARPPSNTSANKTVMSTVQNKVESHRVEEILFKESSVEKSAVAGFLSIIGILEIILSPIVGLVVGSNENVPLGFLIFVSGITGGLILLGFARVIEYLCESAQRLRRIEVLLMKTNNKIPPPKD